MRLFDQIKPVIDQNLTRKKGCIGLEKNLSPEQGSNLGPSALQLLTLPLSYSTDV